MYSLIEQSIALNSVDLLGKIKDSLTVDNNFFNLRKYELNSIGAELIIEKNGVYYNFQASINKNPISGNAIDVNSEVKDFISCFMDKESRSGTFEEKTNIVFGTSSSTDVPCLFFNGQVESYYIYKNDNLDTFVLVFELSTNVFEFLILGEQVVFSENNAERANIFATSAILSETDSIIEFNDFFNPILVNTDFESRHFYSLYKDKMIGRSYSGGGLFESSKIDYSTYYSSIRLNQNYNEAVPNFGFRSRSGSSEPSVYSKSTFANSRTRFDDKNIPLPVYFYVRAIHSDNIGVIPFGFLDGLDYICFDSINPKEILNYGDRSYICFPNFQKTIPADYRDVKSRASGIAIRIS